MSTFKFLAPIKPRYLRRHRRSMAAQIESLTVPQARDACAAFACRLRRDGLTRFVVASDLDGSRYTTDSLIDAVEAARGFYEASQLEAHHAAVALILS